MDHAAAFRRCLSELDVDGMKRLHAETLAHLPPSSDVLVSMHMARTQSEAMGDDKRFYSHRWLQDRGYPSGLPDHLKPRAERVYPREAAAVGISVNARSDLMKPIIPLVHGAMRDAVLEAEADGKLHDAAHVRARMGAARIRTVRQLIGVR